ncbi:hypothetical protein [Roseobacter sp.]|uniref:hypothetical protein n=1 Tax=Roseobacter sp. TaxID=1907202 RepID=UPI003296F999
MYSQPDQLGQSLDMRVHECIHYAVSQDPKSPANSIEMILNELVTEEGDTQSGDGRESVERAMSTVQRIAVQVEDILDYAFAATETAEIENVDINECVEEALANLKSEIEQK